MVPPAVLVAITVLRRKEDRAVIPAGRTRVPVRPITRVVPAVIAVLVVLGVPVPVIGAPVARLVPVRLLARDPVMVPGPVARDVPAVLVGPVAPAAGPVRLRRLWLKVKVL
jgi:hypothetical protein